MSAQNQANVSIRTQCHLFINLYINLFIYGFNQVIMKLFTHEFFRLSFQRLQRRSDEEEDAMKSINENSSNTENPNQSRGDSNSNSVSNSNSSSSNGMGGVIAGGSWVIDSMKSHTTDSNGMENEVGKVVEKVEGEKGVGAGADTVEVEEDGDYVVDIYMQSDVTEGEDPSAPKIPDPGSHIPVVQVDGYAKTIF